MLIVKNNINDFNIRDLKYSSLLLYAELRCDMFSLALPDLKESLDIGNTDIQRNLEHNKWIIKNLQPFLFKSYRDTEYFGCSRSSYSEINIYHLNEDSVLLLRHSDGLYSWQFPNMPEDLCLFSKGKCWLKSVAHEKICWIYTDNDVEKDILKKVIGLKFYEDDDMDAPTLDNIL